MDSDLTMHPLEQPKFSIAMATYNGSRYIAQQLDSIIAQTLPAFEIVICDDVSTDKSFDILQSYANRYPNLIRLYRNDKNLGFIHNFERAITLCQGDFIALCDQDDVWIPTKLEQMAKVFAENPDCGLVFSDADVVDEELTAKGYTVYDKYRRPNLDPAKVIEDFVHKMQLLGCTLAFRSKFLPLVLPIATDEWGHDHWVAFIVASVSRLYMIETPLMLYRRHSTNTANAKVWNNNYLNKLAAKFYIDSVNDLEKRYRKFEDMYLHLSNLYTRVSNDETVLLRHAISVLKDRLDFQKMRVDLCRQSRFQRLQVLLRPSVLRQYTRYKMTRLGIGRDLLR